MNQRYEKLKNLLKELFQLNQPDLDFGIYRIMHAKGKEVTQFLDNDLLPQVQQAFGEYKDADKEEIKKELEEVKKQAYGLGIDPETIPKVKELQGKYNTKSVDINKLESEVYDHLYGFFRRYYHEGDFLSKRVYKPGVYAIPYEGEEVKLHWANADQYYIKSSEYLRDYAFCLQPDNEKEPMRVHFRLVDAAEGEHGNVKETSGKERRFRIAAKDPVAIENGELVIRFTYEPDTIKQKDLNETAEKTVLEQRGSQFSEWLRLLSARHRRADGTESENTRLRVHLDRYTARNTFDYFIHKDLGGFLRRELDFYIKNEVMHLDDIENETALRVEQYLSKIKVIRKIAGKIIDFLAQLEDFQKKLWLKKKFVTETSWCIRIGIIPDEFYKEIAESDAQWQEWDSLHHFDSEAFQANAGTFFAKSNKPKTIGFLKTHPTLMIDTRYFSAGFTTRLLESLGDIDEHNDGVLFHSENFQALNLMQRRYRKKVKCIHIDPPYNTATSGFLYKNDYLHSSWITMMADRLSHGWWLLEDVGHFLCHIDENEQERLHTLCNELQLSSIGTIIWDKKNPMLGRKGIATQHEYILWRSRSDGSVYLRNANQRTILDKAKEIINKYGSATDEAKQEFTRWINEYPGFSGGERAYHFLEDDARVYQSASLAAPEPRTDNKFFIPLIHPLTNKPCPVPPNGWSRAPETMQKLLNENIIIFGEDEMIQPRRKIFLTVESERQVSSVIQDAGRGKTYMDKLGLEFPYCHPVSLYVNIIGAATTRNSPMILDYFAGSGTTGHAVIELNREDGGQRKFILVEMGDYFDTVVLPRLKKVVFTPEWKEGKPKRLATSEETERSPRMFKVIRLESYEDTLNNLELRRTLTQDSLLDLMEAKKPDGLAEQYILRYMLEVESRGSASLLNIDKFTDPKAYTLKVKRPGSEESREITVDLIETFNWLIGLTAEHITAPQAFNAEFQRDSEKRLQINGRLRQEEKGRWWFRTVTGTTPEGRKTLVIWRNRPGNEAPEGIEQDNLMLDEWFTKQGYSSKDSEFDLIYVNGTNNLENLRLPDATWKVRLIEEDFHRLMFEMEEV
jgi:adenine-specific DNA-methyltransferase